MNWIMLVMNDLQFRILLTRTHTGFWHILARFLILRYAEKRVGVRRLLPPQIADLPDGKPGK